MHKNIPGLRRFEELLCLWQNAVWSSLRHYGEHRAEEEVHALIRADLREVYLRRAEVIDHCKAAGISYRADPAGAADQRLATLQRMFNLNEDMTTNAEHLSAALVSFDIQRNSLAKLPPPKSPDA